MEGRVDAAQPARLPAMEQIEAEREAGGVNEEQFSPVLEILQSSKGNIQVRARVPMMDSYMLLETAQVECLKSMCKLEIREQLQEMLAARMAEATPVGKIVVPGMIGLQTPR